MLPTSSSGDLIYVAGRGGVVYVLTYPQGQLVGELSLTYGENSGYICSDTNGDIFIPDLDTILEYAHGGTQPIATLYDAGYIAEGCAVDPVTGNLAVTNPEEYPYQGNVAIYAGAQGDPTDYTESNMYFYLCGYDDSGNLFVDGMGKRFAELPKGSSSFTNIALTKDIANGQVQWDGKYMTLASGTSKVVYRLRISGSTGTIVGRPKSSYVRRCDQQRR